MRTDLTRRAVLPVAALLALLGGAPGPVAGGLALLGLVAAAERLAGLRRLGLVDRVLVGVGGLLVALVLTGILLGSTPLGLSPTSWVVALVVLTVAGLLLAAVLPARTPTTPTTAAATESDRRTTRRTAWTTLPWVAAAVVVIALSVRMTGSSLLASEAPPVEMSLGKVSGTQVQVVVSASEDVGPLEVRTSSDGNEISYPLFDVTAGEPTTVTLSLPEEGRFDVSLTYPDQTQPLRSLVLDR